MFVKGDHVSSRPDRWFVLSRQSPDPTVEQNVVDVPDSAGFVVSSKAVYSFRKHGVVARSAARTCLPSLVQELVLNLTGK